MSEAVPRLPFAAFMACHKTNLFLQDKDSVYCTLQMNRQVESEVLSSKMHYSSFASP